MTLGMGKVLAAGLILSGSASVAATAADRSERARPATFGGAAQHYGEPRRLHRRAAPLTLPPSVFSGAGGVGALPAYGPTYVFYGVTYPRARAFAGATTAAYAASQVRVRIDGCLSCGQ